MKLYITDAPINPGASVANQDDAVSIQLYHLLGDQGIDPLQGPQLLGEPIVINCALLETRLGSREFSECTHIYVIADKKTGALLRVRNKLIDTFPTKNSGTVYGATLGANEAIIAQVYIPFADSPIEDWTVRVNVNSSIKAEVTGGSGVVEGTHDALHEFAISRYPSITVDSVGDTNGSSVITAQLTLGGKPLARSGIRIFALSAIGYLNRREARTNASGQVTLLARKLDIPDTETMTVELGFKYYSNVARVHV